MEGSGSATCVLLIPLSLPLDSVNERSERSAGDRSYTSYPSYKVLKSYLDIFNIILSSSCTNLISHTKDLLRLVGME